MRESARQTRVFVRKYIGEARVKILEDLPRPEEGTVLRHDADLS